MTMKLQQLRTLSILFLCFLSYTHHFSQTKTTYVKNEVQYFHDRTQALNLVKNEQ